ncbi:MAG: hypothetical protein V3U13_04740 [Gemmatimonadota bacterium]|jgi:copper chaperone NosL
MGPADLFRGELSRESRILVIVAALLLIPAAFLPVWKITLVAPQYPNGLSLIIYPGKVAGEIQEVNVLNHYIGMKEISQDEFPEFRFIPFLILRFLALAVLAALVARMEIGALGWIDFIIFGIVMLVDFQHWLYEYGHNLSPSAPITMAPFTPKFIGTTQVANFTVESWPAIGAILMGIAGALGPVAVLLEWRKRRKEETA